MERICAFLLSPKPDTEIYIEGASIVRCNIESATRQPSAWAAIAGDLMNIDLSSEHFFAARAGYMVCMADSESQRREVAGLVGRMYSWRGYQCESTAHLSEDPNRTVFQVRRGDRVIATLTLRMDSAAGLLADGLYGDEIELFRGMDGRLCELTGLAVAPDEDSPEVLRALFQAAYLVGHGHHGASDVFIEINPRHVSYYRRIGFRAVGPLRTCPRVAAPAILMHLDLDDWEQETLLKQRIAA